MKPIQASPVPLLTWLLGLPGIVLFALGVLLMAGDFASVHPLLDGPGAGLALLVSAIALLGSAAFPLVLRRLSERDQVTDSKAGNAADSDTTR